MPSQDEAASSSPIRLQEDPLSYYKAQYEQLESELADFQSSSKELEAELEKDVEAAEKRERQLQEKVETLGYEVEEWKVRPVTPPYSVFRKLETPFKFCSGPQLIFGITRRSINSRRRKQMQHKTPFKRRLQPSATRIEPYN